MTRKWEPREQRMVTDYLIEKHPNAKHMTRVRVGALPPEAESLVEKGISPKLYTPVLHWADGIALYPNRTVIIEAKIKLTSDALGQILTNANAFYKTEEFSDRWNKPLAMEVVYAYPDEQTLRMLQTHGIKAVRYRPEYIREYYIEKMRTIYGK